MLLSAHSDRYDLSPLTARLLTLPLYTTFVMASIEQYTESLTLLEHLGDGFETDVVRVLEELAVCFDQSGEHERSLAYQARAKQILEKDQGLP
jgi:hypothetical protein